MKIIIISNHLNEQYSYQFTNGDRYDSKIPQVYTDEEAENEVKEFNDFFHDERFTYYHAWSLEVTPTEDGVQFVCPWNAGYIITLRDDKFYFELANEQFEVDNINSMDRVISVVLNKKLTIAKSLLRSHIEKYIEELKGFDIHLNPDEINPDDILSGITMRIGTQEFDI